jgi:hypothetical protein
MTSYASLLVDTYFATPENFQEGAIVKTTDGGMTWKRFKVNVTDPQPNANLEGVGFTDEDHGWVGGWGDITFQTGFTASPLMGASSGSTPHKRSASSLTVFDFLVTPSLSDMRRAKRCTSTRPSRHRCPRQSQRSPPLTHLLERVERAEGTRPVSIQITVPPNAARLKISIWDRFGKQVRQLLDEAQPPDGSRRVTWNVTSDAGNPLGSGNFILRVTVNDRSDSHIVWAKP